MERPCRSSWTGAHENFQAEEYDAGASLTHQASQRVEQKGQLGSTSTHFEMLGNCCALFNKGIHKEAHLYCKGDLEPLSSRP